MAKKLALVLGVVLVLVGIAGLMGGFNLIGSGSLFVMNSTLVWFHLIIGIVLLAVAYMAAMRLSMVLMVVGVVYVLVGIVGFFGTPVLGFFDVNGATNVLHVILGVVMFWGGMKSKGMMM